MSYKMIKITKVTTILLIIMFISTCATRQIHYNTSLQKHREARLHQFTEENSRLKNEKYIIFLGNSLTEGFPIEQFYPDKRILNRGIVADHIGLDYHGILQRMNVSIFQCKPEKIFLMIGVNDLADKNFTPNKLAQGVNKIIQKIQNFDSGIKIHILSALPATGKYAHLNQLIIRYNQRLKKLSNKHKIKFINLYNDYLDVNNELNSIYTKDGLHLNFEGYKIWKEKIDEYL